MPMTTTSPATSTICNTATTTMTTRIGGVFLSCLFLILIISIGLKNSSYSTIPIITKSAMTSSSSTFSSSFSLSSIFRSTRRRRRLHQKQQQHEMQEANERKEQEELQRQEVVAKFELKEENQKIIEEGSTIEEELVEAKLYEEDRKAEKYDKSEQQEQNQQIESEELDTVRSLGAGADAAGEYDEVAVDVDKKDMNKELLIYDIPNQFSYDKYYNILPFPRWEFDYHNSNNNDMQTSIMDSLIDFINKQCESLSQFNYSLKYTDPEQYKDDLSKMTYSDLLPHTSDHRGEYDTPEGWEPEQLYVVDGEKRLVMTSQYTKDISDTNGYSINVKYNPTERLMHEGLNFLFNNEHDNEAEQIIPLRWPNLYQLLVIENGSFPFLAQYSDFIGCNYHNWNNGTESIPLFTVAGNVHCNYTFPFPNSGLSWGSKYFTYLWYDQFKDYKDKYGEWKNRISKIIWRGNLSGKMPKAINERGPRYHLNYFINNNLTIEESNLFDIRLTELDNLARNEWIDPNELGGYNDSYKIPQDDYQQYKAILDVDGHSWSGRFASLLCYSSVVLKLEPDYVDYFYSPVTIILDDDNVKDNSNEQQRALIPWKHYIPIKRDLSDLVEKVQYVIDPVNEEHVLHIIDNANEWCAQRLVLRSLGLDALDIFEKYITILDQSSQLKNLFQSSNNHTHISEDDERRLSSSSYEDHTDWKTQWNQMKDSVYNSVLQMEPANPSW